VGDDPSDARGRDLGWWGLPCWGGGAGCAAGCGWVGVGPAAGCGSGSDDAGAARCGGGGGFGWRDSAWRAAGGFGLAGLGVSGPGFGRDVVDVGCQRVAIFRIWMGWVAQLRSNCSGMIMGLLQGIDNAGSEAFPPDALRMDVFASFFKKKRLDCFWSFWARWIATPPESGSQ